VRTPTNATGTRGAGGRPGGGEKTHGYPDRKPSKTAKPWINNTTGDQYGMQRGKKGKTMKTKTI